MNLIELPSSARFSRLRLLATAVSELLNTSNPFSNVRSLTPAIRSPTDVAVTGLPDPRADHAVIMARFAKECILSLQRMTKELEVSLGPDTADLCMRIGLHSGPGMLLIKQMWALDHWI